MEGTIMRDAIYAILNFEQDWDDPYVYIHISEKGLIVKYNILTEELIEYQMGGVVH
jgi:hypothetical protein